MPTMSSYEHGVPCWVDLSTPDIQASARFYSELLGWETEDTGEQTGHYTLARRSGRQVAAVSPAQDPSAGACWNTYMKVDDAAEVSARVTAAGGTVQFGPMDVMTLGRMAVCTDPTGAQFSLWQPGDHTGAELVNEEGALAWNELATSDLDRAKQFYSDVLGWTWGGGPDYAEGQVGGRTICGAMPRPADLPAGVPDHWLVYFATSDADAGASRAQELGATLLHEPTDIPGIGRFAVLSDPQGGAFALFAPPAS
jgi:predicted enzyme related to lactoylglutathione lyase